MAQRILVTGGAGFIGSHLSEALVQRGDTVTVLDDLSTGAAENLASLASHAHFRFVCGSVLDEELVDELIRDHDQIYHLASAVGVKLVMSQGVQAIRTIFGGTENVLRAAAWRRRRILLTSTSEVYGKGVSVPFREDDDVLTGPTTRHRWAYAAAKSLDEFLSLAYFREFNLPVVVTRLFNTVGPRQSGQYGMVLPRFVRAALANEPLEVHGDGLQTRCFAHVADVVNGLLKAMDGDACVGQVVNLGNDQETSIRSLALAIIAELDSSSPIRHIPYAEAYDAGFEDMRRRVPCLERARRLLGYRPVRSLRAIIRDVAEHFKTATDSKADSWIARGIHRKPASSSSMRNVTEIGSHARSRASLEESRS